MTRSSGSRTLFDDALDEARRIVKDAPRGTSFAVILGGPAPQALSATPSPAAPMSSPNSTACNRSAACSAPTRRSAWPPWCSPKANDRTATSLF